MPWREVGSKKTGYLRITSSNLKNSSSQWRCCQVKITGWLHGWTRRFWQNSNTRVNRRWKQVWETERNTETLSKHAEMGLESYNHLELNLASNVKSNKKGFYKCLTSKRRRLVTMWADCWIGEGLCWYRTWERLRYWMPPSPQSLLSRPSFRNSKFWKMGKVYSKEGLLLVEEDQIRIYLSKLDIHKCMGPDGMHLCVPKGTLWCHYTATLGNLWMIIVTGRGAWGLEESHFCLQKGQERGPREQQAHQPHLHPWEGDETANPGNCF